MGNPKDINLAMSEAIDNAKKTFLLRTELFAIAAAETKAKYDAFVSAGFTADQAMALCCADMQRK